MFVATFIYSLLLLADISPRGEGRVPNLSVLFAVVLVGISVLVFLRLIADVTDSIRSGRVVADVGRSGRRVIEATFPLPVTADTPPSSSGAARYTPDAPGHEVGCPRSGGGVLQAMDLDGIVAIAVEARVTVELVPEIGEFVSTGAPVFRVYGASQTIGARLLNSVAFGDERTFRQDPRSRCASSSMSRSRRCRLQSMTRPLPSSRWVVSRICCSCWARAGCLMASAGMLRAR